MQKRTLCIINNIPTPYRRALFDEIASQADSAGISFSALYLAETETVRDWTVEIRDFETVLPVLWQKRNKRTPTSDFIVNTRFATRALGPRHVILFGYNYPTYIITTFIRAVFRRPTHLFCETTLADKRSTGWKRTFKSIFFSAFFDKFIVPGKRSAEYLMAHGVPKERIFFARNGSSMYPTTPPVPPRMPKLRLLFVGRLAPEKRILEYVRTFAELRTGDCLSIVGDGPDANTISAIAETHSTIEMLGTIGQDQLPEIYSRHDVLVLVSDSEPWGLVVNEAVNFGLALLLSPHVGSAPDLLDGNGAYLEEVTFERLSCVLRDIKDNLTKYREQSLRISSASTVKQQASGFITVATDPERSAG